MLLSARAAHTLAVEDFFPITVPVPSGIGPSETVECPFALPPEYAEALRVRQDAVHAIREQFSTVGPDLDAAQQREVHDAVYHRFHDWLQRSGNLRQITDLIAASD